LSTSVEEKPAVEVSTDLAIGGMTCGACANRIERKLNKVDGVTATVNYATEKAAVTHPGTLTPTPPRRPTTRARTRCCASTAPGC
jgi:P-type Cu+ transporter